MTTPNAKYPPQVLEMRKLNHGLDDDGVLVVNYEIYRGDGTLLGIIQSTDHDAVFFPKADKWTVGWVDHRHIDSSRTEGSLSDDYVWPSPSGSGWVDAWNGWYQTEAEAREDGAAGVGQPWILRYGEDIITQEEADSRREPK